MIKLLVVGSMFCAFAAASTLPANAIPMTPASGFAQVDNETVLVKGGHGRGHSMGRGNRGRHIGWSRGRRGR